MKKSILGIAIITLCLNLNAQITESSNGNVGIGISPGAKLDVNGDAFVGSLSSRRYLKIVSKEWPEIRFQTPTSDRQIRLGVSHLDNATYGTGEGDFYVYSATSNSMPFIVKKGGDVSLGLKKGNVGIGVSNPGAKLSIKDNNQVLNFIVNKKLTGTWPPISENRTMTIQSSGSNSGNLAFANGNRESMRITASGSIGIGTVIPGAKLDVNGDVSVGNLSSRRYLKIASKEWPEIRFQTPVSDREIRIGVSHADNSRYGTGEGDFYVYSARSNSMPFIVKKGGDISLGLKKGNVGIGTTDSKGFKLGVNGKIAATEVKVATYANWPDFVFKESHNLPTLKEVENHIKEKGYLENIPSAEEVKKDGFFLGEMDAKLLQKIEELMLYTIQQEKKIKETNSNNIKLLSIIEKLEKRITKLERK